MGFEDFAAIEGFTRQGVILAPLSSWQIGGPAEYLSEPRTREELLLILKWSRAHQKKIHIFGGGSNVLIADEGVAGVVILMRSFSGVVLQKEANGFLQVRVRSGTPKSQLLKLLLKYNSSAALFLAGLPGDVGGGVVMNAGVSENLFPREFCDVVSAVKVLRESGEEVEFLASQIKWSYRHSSGWQPGVITEVEFRFAIQDDPDVARKVKELNHLRLQKQPLDKPSCGSVFRNPLTGLKAAQLIDQCGLKGFQIGSAQVSTKHANFIINLGGATAADVWALIQQVRAQVLQKFGVDLNTEVIRLGKI